MPDISGYHGLFVQAHVVGVLLFVAAHAVSAFVLLSLMRERDPSKLRRLLKLSSRSFPVAGIGFFIWFIAGVLAGFSGSWWTSGRYWIWASLVLAVVIAGLMTPMGRLYLNRIREAVGIDPKTGAVNEASPVDAAALNAAIASGHPAILATIGIGGLLTLFYLMIAKPF